MFCFYFKKIHSISLTNKFYIINILILDNYQNDLHFFPFLHYIQ